MPEMYITGGAERLAIRGKYTCQETGGVDQKANRDRGYLWSDATGIKGLGAYYINRRQVSSPDKATEPTTIHPQGRQGICIFYQPPEIPNLTK